MVSSKCCMCDSLKHTKYLVHILSRYYCALTYVLGLKSINCLHLFPGSHGNDFHFSFIPCVSSVKQPSLLAFNPVQEPVSSPPVYWVIGSIIFTIDV